MAHIRLSICLLLLWSGLAIGDALRPEIREYKHPVICKPVIKKDGLTIIGERDTWIVLPWATLETLDDKKMVFKTKDGKFTVPTTGYICILA